MTNSAEKEAKWSGSALFAKAGIIRVQQGLTHFEKITFKKVYNVRFLDYEKSICIFFRMWAW